MKLIKDKEANEIYILDRIKITYLDTKNNYTLTSSADSVADLLKRFVDIDLDDPVWKEK